jgi:hypothetical protein
MQEALKGKYKALVDELRAPKIVQFGGKDVACMPHPLELRAADAIFMLAARVDALEKRAAGLAAKRPAAVVIVSGGAVSAWPEGVAYELPDGSYNAYLTHLPTEKASVQFPVTWEPRDASPRPE